MDYTLFELATLSHIEKYKGIIQQQPSTQRATYMNVAADIPISEFFRLADEIRRENNFVADEEYNAKIKSLVSNITFGLFEYCRQTTES